MENGYNQNGQFGGWATQNNGQYGYNNPLGYEQQAAELAKKAAERQNIKEIGSKCGLAIILYIAISYGISFFIVIISWAFPSISRIYTESAPMLAFDILQTIFAIGVPFLIAYIMLKKEKNVGVLPFGTVYDKKTAIRLVMVFLPVMVFSAVGINYLSAFLQSLMGIEFTGGASSLEIKGWDGTLLGVLAVAVVPAIIEEAAVRGVVMQPLRRYGDKFAIILSAIFFACMHGNMVQIPYTVIGGLIMGYLAVVTGSLWPSIVLHFINNLYSLIILSAGDNLGSVATTVVTAIMFIGFAISGIVGVVKLAKEKPQLIRLDNGDSKLTIKEKLSAFVLNGPCIVAVVLLTIVTISNINF